MSVESNGVANVEDDVEAVLKGMRILRCCAYHLRKGTHGKPASKAEMFAATVIELLIFKGDSTFEGD